MKNPLKKVGNKTRILLAVIFVFLVSVGAGFYLMSRGEETAEAAIGGSATINSTGTTYYYGSTNTSMYSVVSGSGTYEAMCVIPSKGRPAGKGKISRASESLANYQSIVNVMVLTDGRHEGGSATPWGIWSQSASKSWTEILTEIAGSYSGISDQSDAAYVVGHIIVGYLYSGDTTGGVSESAINKWNNEIQSFFASDFPQDYKTHKLYLAVPEDTTKQTVGWIEDVATTTTIRFQKVDEDDDSVGLANAVLIINGGVTVTTDADGYTPEIVVKTNQNVSYCESVAPAGYDIDESISCSAGHYAEVNCPDAGGCTMFVSNKKQILGGIKVHKSANYNGLGTGQTSIAGIQFGVYSNSSCTALEQTLTLDSSGNAQTGDIYRGGSTHYVKEIASTATSHGFVPNTSCTAFTVGSTGGTPSTPLSFTNDAIRGGLKVKKTRSVYGASNANFSGVSFDIYNSAGTKVKTITTGSDGVATTGSTDLVYDTYTVKEVSGTVNQAFNVVSNFNVDVKTNGTISDAGTKNDTFRDNPNLSTVARNSNSSASNPSKDIEISETASITDAVSFGTTLQSDLSYRLVSTLYEVSSGTQVATATTSVSGGSSSIETVFSNFNSSDYIGKTLGIKQELQVQNNGQWLTLTIHNANLSDTNEQVKVKEIEIDTTAISERGANNKTLWVGNVKAIDTVEIVGLIRGRSYVVKGQLIDQNGNVVPLRNGSGNTVTSNISYTGTTGAKYTMPAMEFEFDSSNYIGQKIVVYQTLYASDGTTVLQVHKDATDADQILTVLVPEISTIATNNGPGSETKMLNVGNTSVKDVVTYKYLAAGTTFVLKGELINKNTGGRIGDVQTVSFTASGEESGTTSTTPMVFPVNTAELFDINASEQAKLVVFEKLYRTTSSTAALVTHEDLNDADQTVGIVTPTLETTAKNNGSGDDEKMLNVGNTSVRDTVRFTGLVPGDTYTLTGTLRNLDDNAAVVSGPVTVTIPQEDIESDGSGETDDIVFELDTTLLFDYSKAEQAKLVVYENLYYSTGVHLAKHEDDSDADQTVQIRVPEIQTMARDKYGEEGKEQMIMVGDATVKDTISYEGLVEGDWYMVVGTLMDPETGEILTMNGQFIRNSTTFKAGENGKGTVDVEINLDTTTIQGKHYVAFESLYRSQDKHGDGRVLAKHEDWDDESQTVTIKVTKIETVAKDGTGSEPDGDNVIMPEPNQKIVDTVSYEGVMREETYTLVGVLVDKETGEPILVNGEKITASATFDSPSRKDYGKVEMTFEFDGTDMPGQEIVVFERLYRGATETDEPTAVHEDLEDANQYIKVRERIGTTAVDYVDGDQKVGVGNAVIMDTVKYEGLKVGKSYVMVGSLVDKTSGEVVDLVQRCIEKPLNTGEVVEESDGDEEGEDESEDEEDEDCFESRKAIEIAKFTVGTADPNGQGETEGTTGTVKLYFGVNTRKLSGKSLVVFEKLYTEEEYEKYERGEEAETVITHEDINDAEQTVKVSDPKLSTTAIDKIDDDKEMAANSVVVMTDKVQYEGLVAGTEYKLKGVLMDKGTGKVVEFANGGETSKELSFVARGESGVVDMNFEFNTEGMSGTEIVVFEELYTEDITTSDGEEFEEGEMKIGEHRDLNDQKQTVWVKVVANTPDTGLFSKQQLENARRSGAIVAIFGILVFSTAGVFTVRYIRKKQVKF